MTVRSPAVAGLFAADSSNPSHLSPSCGGSLSRLHRASRIPEVAQVDIPRLEREVAAAHEAGNKTAPGYPLRILGGDEHFPKARAYFGSIRYCRRRGRQCPHHGLQGHHAWGELPSCPDRFRRLE
mgnify:CR=1 FL=1|jgi:hypothetical protein